VISYSGKQERKRREEIWEEPAPQVPPLPDADVYRGL